MRRSWRDDAQNWGMEMSEQDKIDMAALDAFLDQAKHAPVPEISQAAMARILDDAQRHLPGPVAYEMPKPGWRDWIAALGGWPAMSGLMAAGVAGLWIGVAPSETMSDVMAGMMGESVSVSLFPEADIFDLEFEG